MKPQFLLTAGYDFSDVLDLHDITNLFVQQEGYKVAAKDKDGHRTLTVVLLVQGDTTDEVNQHEADLNWKLEQAEQAYGPNGVGAPVIFWAKLGDNQNWTYWTVIGGKATFEDIAATNEKQMKATLELLCLPQATGDPIVLPPTPATDSEHPIFVGDVIGDCSALVKLVIRNTGLVPIHGFEIARRGHRNLAQGGFKPFYKVQGNIALTTDWQTVAEINSPQGPFDSGIFDVIWRVSDGSKPLKAITDLSAALQPTGNLMGGFYEYIVSSLDAFGKESAASNAFDITVPTGTSFINDPNPDPSSLKWGGPIFLGGTVRNIGNYGVDLPGRVVSTSAGLEITCQSDGWILSDLIQTLLVLPGVKEKGYTGATNKLLPKEGELGFSYTGLIDAFPAPLTGQLTFQYDLRLENFTPGLAPIFFPQIAPFGMMYSPFGWALYASTANSSQDIATLVSDWKDSKLAFTVFNPKTAFSSTPTVKIAYDWRNGSLMGTLSINGVEYASIEAPQAKEPAHDVYLGVAVAQVVAEPTFQKIVNPDEATWSFTKVSLDSSTKAGTDSKSTSESVESSKSHGTTTSKTHGHSHTDNDEDNSTTSGNEDHSQTHSHSDDSGHSDGGGHSHTDSTATTMGPSGFSTSSGSGDEFPESHSHNDTHNHTDGHSDGGSGGGSGGGGGGSSDSDEDSNSDGFNDSDSSSSSSSTSSSMSDSDSLTSSDGIEFDIPLSGFTRDVQSHGTITQTTESSSTSSSTSMSMSKSLSNSHNHSTTDSHTHSFSFSSNGSNSHSDGGSGSSSDTGGHTTSTNDSSSNGSSSDAGEVPGGASVTSNRNNSSSSNSSSSDPSSHNDSSSQSHSHSDSNSHSHSTSDNKSHSDSDSDSDSNSSSTNTSSSSESSTSKSKSRQLVFQVRPKVPTILPDPFLSALAQVGVRLSNVIVADGPIGPGQAVLLTWTAPVINAQNQRVYRILNTGSGSPGNAWQYKILGATDNHFLDNGDIGWLPGTPPDAFAGPKSASLRLAYASTPGDKLRYTKPVDAQLSNGRPEFSRVKTLVLPTAPSPEPETPVGPFYVALQAKTDDVTLSQHPTLSADGCWLLSQREPQFQAQLDPGQSGLVEIRLDHRRDKRNSGFSYDLATAALLATLDVKGALSASPGGNYITILATDANGVADPEIRFTAQVIYTPCTEYASGLG